jgi:hypothetical protein
MHTENHLSLGNASLLGMHWFRGTKVLAELTNVLRRRIHQVIETLRRKVSEDPLL